MDRQEYVFTFATPTGQERIATCEVQVDYGSPLLLAVAAAVAQFVPIPVT